jgi:mRNA-degrading endonuclease HigB of HigAB toxin-antitoxin module
VGGRVVCNIKSNDYRLIALVQTASIVIQNDADHAQAKR